jgi:hypothetical protein
MKANIYKKYDDLVSIDKGEAICVKSINGLKLTVIPYSGDS